jgi:hypothetical protein
VGKIENRKEPRRALRYRACVLDLQGKTLGLCLVSDVSETGARLEVPLIATNGHLVDVPDEFVLMLARRGGAYRKCHAMWRTDHHVGVQFQRETKKVTPNWKPMSARV